MNMESILDEFQGDDDLFYGFLLKQIHKKFPIDMSTPIDIEKVKALKKGDVVTRCLAGRIDLPGIVEDVEGNEIKVIMTDENSDKEVTYIFNRETGFEIDEVLGFDGVTFTGSYLKF